MSKLVKVFSAFYQTIREKVLKLLLSNLNIKGVKERDRGYKKLSMSAFLWYLINIEIG